MLIQPEIQIKNKMCKGEETVCERLLGHPVEGSENSKEQHSFQKMVKNPFQELYSRNFDIPEGRTIYLSRHGESEFNLEDRIGGDSNLTPRGQQYAKSLGLFMKTADIPDLQVWTSSLVRTKQTAAYTKAPKQHFHEIDEINAGKFDGYTYDEVLKSHPEEFEARAKDKLGYRYPEGESYIDCCQRIIKLLERMETTNENLLIVAHQAILRCVVTYFLKGDMQKLPHVKIPQHCLIRVTFSCGENIIDYVRTPIDHSEQGIVASILNDSDESKVLTKTAI